MEIRWLGEVCSALPSSGGRGHSCDHQAMPLKRSREGVPAFCTIKGTQLILTDPPCSDDADDLYSWLADFAEKVLIPGGSLILFTGHYRLPRDFEIFKRIFAIVSTTSIPTSASANQGSQCGPSVPGSRLDADHPEKGVLFARRFTPYCS